MKQALLALALSAAVPATAADYYPLGKEYEWVYLAFEDMGPRGLAFSHKMVRRVLAERPGPGGTFYWVREATADPDVGPGAGARFATDLLKMPFKAEKVSADEILFKDATHVYLKLRVAPPLRGPEEFEKQCALFEADKEPYRLRSQPLLPVDAKPGDKWEGPASKSRASERGPWLSEALRKEWREVLTVLEESPGRTQRTVFADGIGAIGWFAKAPKADAYFELAERRFEAPPAVELTPELAELRKRGILGPEQTQVRPEDLALLAEMHEAEREGGVDFLKAKAGTLEPYVIEHKVPGRPLELWLNAKGFETFRFHLSQEAIHDFEKLDIQLKYVFYLVDGAEQPLFDEEGLLTDAGETVYYAMRRGDKAVWKLPGQSVPTTSSGPGDDAKALALLAKGYEEVTSEELHYLMKATTCRRSQLEELYTLKTVYDKKQKKDRYFFHKDDGLMNYVGVHRAGKDAPEVGHEVIQGMEGTGGMCPE